MLLLLLLYWQYLYQSSWCIKNIVKYLYFHGGNVWVTKLSLHVNIYIQKTKNVCLQKRFVIFLCKIASNMCCFLFCYTCIFRYQIFNKFFDMFYILFFKSFCIWSRIVYVIMKIPPILCYKRTFMKHVFLVLFSIYFKQKQYI